jgi:hypothetical protein
MRKRTISVSLREEHLVWLRGQSRAARHRSVSETLDRLIAEARMGGRHVEGAMQSDRSGVQGPARSVRPRLAASPCLRPPSPTRFRCSSTLPPAGAWRSAQPRDADIRRSGLVEVIW